MRNQAKGTNWKQKFQKPQNENIGLTNLNMENKCNFPILSFETKLRYWKNDRKVIDLGGIS